VEAVAHGEDCWNEYEVRRPDGEARQIRAIAKPVFDAGGRVTGLRGVRIDTVARMTVGARHLRRFDTARICAGPTGDEKSHAEREEQHWLLTFAGYASVRWNIRIVGGARGRLVVEGSSLFRPGGFCPCR